MTALRAQVTQLQADLEAARAGGHAQPVALPMTPVLGAVGGASSPRTPSEHVVGRDLSLSPIGSASPFVPPVGGSRFSSKSPAVVLGGGGSRRPVAADATVQTSFDNGPASTESKAVASPQPAAVPVAVAVACPSTPSAPPPPPPPMPAPGGGPVSVMAPASVRAAAGGPPPPPPPMMGMPGGGAGGASAVDLPELRAAAPKVPMKKLFWTKIPDYKVRERV